MPNLSSQALPLFVNKLVSEVVSIIIAVTAVLIFGEIIPQVSQCNLYRNTKSSIVIGKCSEVLPSLQSYSQHP